MSANRETSEKVYFRDRVRDLDYVCQSCETRAVPQACPSRHHWPSGSLLSCNVMSLPSFVPLLKRTILKMSFCLKVFNSPSSPSACQAHFCVCVRVCRCVRVFISYNLYSRWAHKQEPLRCRWGCWRVCVFPHRYAAIYSQGSCFVTRSLNVAQLRDMLTRCISLQCRGHLYALWPLVPAAWLQGLTKCVPGLFRNCQFFCMRSLSLRGHHGIAGVLQHGQDLNVWCHSWISSIKVARCYKCSTTAVSFRRFRRFRAMVYFAHKIRRQT